jgi:tyrosyl-tRNA synthetase
VIIPAVEQPFMTTIAGSVSLTPRDEWEKKLLKSQQTGVPLRIKLGFDPTAPDIHFGHVVVLQKLRQLQDLGHTVILLISDFTAAIGDPSGRNSTRPVLSHHQIQLNAETYCDQAWKVLDQSKTEVRWNSEWCNALGARGLVELAAKHTVARMLERDDFAKRLQAQTPISIHEFLYPLLQGYDSVALNADLEIGGTDQTFNLMVGRQLQEAYGLSPQCILTMPLLVGTDGTHKMSKSKNNYIGVATPPEQMFSQVMAISDKLMWDWIPLLSGNGQLVAQALVRRSDVNCRDIKVTFAKELVTRFHSAELADRAHDDFVNRSNGGIPAEVRDFYASGGARPVTSLLKESGLCPSMSEAGRKIEQRGIRIDGVVEQDKRRVIEPGTYVMQVGKRNFARIHLS